MGMTPTPPNQSTGQLPQQPPRLVNVHEAKTQLSRLLQHVEAGEEIWIARAGQPVARLSAWQPAPSAVRAPGAMRSAIQITADFDTPLTGQP